MRRILLVALIVASVAVASPAHAKSLKPDGVTTAQWVDYCDHTTDLVIAIDGIADRIINDPQAGIATTYVDMLVFTALDLRHDANKIDGKLGDRIEKLSRAVTKLQKTYAATGKLKLRGLSIAADPLPDCP